MRRALVHSVPVLAIATACVEGLEMLVDVSDMVDRADVARATVPARTNGGVPLDEAKSRNRLFIT